MGGETVTMQWILPCDICGSYEYTRADLVDGQIVCGECMAVRDWDKYYNHLLAGGRVHE